MTISESPTDGPRTSSTSIVSDGVSSDTDARPSNPSTALKPSAPSEDASSDKGQEANAATSAGTRVICSSPHTLSHSQEASVDSRKKKHAVARKRGNKGHFEGEQLEWLRSQLKHYLTIKGKPARSSQLVEIQHRYVTRYPWHLEGIPERFEVLENSDVSPESTGLSQDQFEALKEEKKAYLKELVPKAQVTVKNWILRNASQANQGSNAVAPFVGVIKQLCNVGHSPRRMKDFKFYMAHHQFKDKVGEEFQERWKVAGLPKSQRLDFHCTVAKELFEAEPKDVREMIAAENEAAYLVKDEAYEQLMNGDKLAMADLAKVEEQFGDLANEICQGNLAKFIQPLLDIVRALTGLKLVLLAGKPPNENKGEDEFTLITISSGETAGETPRKFELWNIEEFTKNVIGTFMKFLLQTKSGDSSGSDASVTPDSTTVTAMVDKAAQQLAAQKHTDADVGISLHSLDDPSLITMDDEDGIHTTGELKGKKAGNKRKSKKKDIGPVTKRTKTKAAKQKTRTESEVETSESEPSDSELPAAKTAEPVRRSTRPKPIPVNVGAFKARVPSEWSIPSGLLEVLGALEGEEKRKEMKELLQRVDTSQEDDFYTYGQSVVRRRDIQRFRAAVPNACEIPATVIEALETMRSGDRRSQIAELLRRTATPGDFEVYCKVLIRSFQDIMESNSESAFAEKEREVGLTDGVSDQVVKAVTGDADEEAPAVQDVEKDVSVASPADDGSTEGMANSPSLIGPVPTCPSNSDVIVPAERTASPQSSLSASGAETSTSQPQDIQSSSFTSPSTEPVVEDPLLITAPSVELVVEGQASSNVPREDEGLFDVDVGSVEREDWPKWLETAFDTLSELGEFALWRKILVLWVSLERKYGWANPDGQNAFYTPTGRPTIVSTWSKERKKIRSSPPEKMEDVDDFCGIWWDWWSILNPEWRTRDYKGRIVTDGNEGKEKDRWEVMKKPGQCGILSTSGMGESTDRRALGPHQDE
ncbi:hypothetical protein VKT23_008430 [Stygiomarasmius scandens]|uniref:Uncharacterized protein n=1 Tax=Marasmiellus scandens TaxID=2682957 RepID=A0ABR1JHH9_9AGAR